MPIGGCAGITLTYARSRMKNPLLSINVNAKSFTSLEQPQEHSSLCSSVLGMCNPLYGAVSRF